MAKARIEAKEHGRDADIALHGQFDVAIGRLHPSAPWHQVRAGDRFMAVEDVAAVHWAAAIQTNVSAAIDQ